IPQLGLADHADDRGRIRGLVAIHLVIGRAARRFQLPGRLLGAGAFGLHQLLAGAVLARIGNRPATRGEPRPVAASQPGAALKPSMPGANALSPAVTSWKAVV